MASFFQQLIDLGEEKSVAAKQQSTDEELGRMTREDLVNELRKHQQALEEKETERKRVQEEALANQSKHEAYRKNVDMWQQQMKEMRAADKKMIDELRAAGATGKIDDAYVKSTTETIEGLKQSLKEARDDAAKAYKRQREAEEMRTAFEKTSKQDYEGLFAKFEHFREKSKESQERLEQQIVNLSDDNGNLRERLSLVTQQMSQKAQDQQQLLLDSSNSDEELKRLRAALANAEKKIEEMKTLSEDRTQGGEAAELAPQSTAKADRADTVTASDVALTGANGATESNEAVVSELKAAMAEQTQAVNTLNNECSNLKLQLAAAVAKEQEVELKYRKSEDRLKRLEADLEWSKVEGDKKSAELKGITESLKAKLQQSEAKLEAKDEEMRTAERTHKRVVRDLEDIIAAEKEKFAQLTRKTEEKVQFLEEQIQQEKERSAATKDKAGEAEETSKRSNEALEAQRMHFEIQIAQRETRIQELYGVRQALEAALQESKDDVRRKEDVIQDLRREVDIKTEELRESEQSQSELQRTIMLREDDLQAREKERQSLRTRLRDEEDRAVELHTVVRELELRVTEMDVENKRRETQRTMQEAELVRLQTLIEGCQETINSQNALLKVREAQVSEATRRLQDQGVRNADIVRLREDQISTIRSYEKKINELEKQVALAQSASLSTMNGTSVDKGGFGLDIGSSLASATHGYASQMERRQAMLSEAFASARRSTGLTNLTSQQVKMIVIGAVVLVVFISVINGLRSLSAAGLGTTEFDSLSIVREKYTQALASLATCREQLAADKAKQ